MDLSLFNIPSREDQINTLKLQKARLIKLRWFYISFLTTIAAVTNLIAGHPLSVAWRYIEIGIIVSAINAILFFINKKVRTNLRMTQAFLILQLLLDLSVATFVIYDQGGLQARTTILFALPIISAGMLFTESIVYFTAALASLGYVSSVVLFSINRGIDLDLSTLLVPIIFYPAFFLVLARIVVYLMRLNINETRERAYDSFLALLAHQLIHPASTANAIIDQLEQTSPKFSDKQKKYVKMLKSENQNLMQLLNNLIETASTSQLVKISDAVELPHLLQRTSYVVADSHQRSDDLKLSLEDMSLIIKGDEGKLKVALTNILNNAFEYSDKGTPVAVSAKNAGSNVVIKIDDKGGGITEEIKKELFKKYNIHSKGEGGGIQGVGLGLYVARKIILAHGGSLHVVSDPSGTKVMVTLKKGRSI